MPKVLAFTRHHLHPTRGGKSEAFQDDVLERGKRSQVHAFARGRPRLPNQPESATCLAVSVVVPTCGRPELLNRCLASLVLQHFDAHRFEILVVDDRPSDATRQVVMRWAEHAKSTGLKMTYIPSPGPHGPAAARNFGWRAARGAIVAFTDDDTIASAGWLENGLIAFDSEVHAVWGRITMPLHGRPTDYELDAKGLESAVFVTANCFCRRSVLEKIGGFDQRFRFAWREDSDLYFRLLDFPANIVHAPAALITHPIRPAGWGVSLSQLKKIQFDALLYKKHPSHYREKIRRKPRWDFYFTVLVLAAALISLLAGWSGAALVAGAAWLYMTGRFCWRRLRHTSKAPVHVAEMIVTSILIPPMAVYWRAVGAIRFRAGLL